jgi:hypothetical protein
MRFRCGNKECNARFSIDEEVLKDKPLLVCPVCWKSNIKMLKRDER